MTVAMHPPAHRRSPPPPARAPEHERDARARSQVLLRPRPTPRSGASSPSKTPTIGASAENSERGSLPTPRSSAVRDPQIPIGAPAKRSPQPPRGFLLGRLSSAGPGRGPTVAKGRRPKPFTNARVPELDSVRAECAGKLP